MEREREREGEQEGVGLGVVWTARISSPLAPSSRPAVGATVSEGMTPLSAVAQSHVDQALSVLTARDAG